MLKKILILISITVVGFSSLIKVAKAEEIVISGNGASSTSEVKVDVQNNTTVTQSNQADVQNNVADNADTGENQASGNNSDQINIQTGSVNSETNINNENINTNVAESICCGENSANVQISGNGTDSTNTVNANTGSNTTINQSNVANITNNVTINANTGNNTANENSGDVKIETGNITALTNIKNKNINYNNDPVGQNTLSYLLKISGNGENSNNEIIFTNPNFLTINDANFINLVNNVFHNLNTGGNTANGNSGMVFIKTGDIDSKVNIENININTNIAKVECCKEKPTPPTPPPTPPPSTPPPSGGNGGGPGDGRSDGRSDGGSSGSSIAQAVLGAMLPVTGNYLTFLAMIFATILFMIGIYLRKTSDVSPPALAKK